MIRGFRASGAAIAAPSAAAKCVRLELGGRDSFSGPGGLTYVDQVTIGITDVATEELSSPGPGQHPKDRQIVHRPVARSRQPGRGPGDDNLAVGRGTASEHHRRGHRTPNATRHPAAIELQQRAGVPHVTTLERTGGAGLHHRRGRQQKPAARGQTTLTKSAGSGGSLSPTAQATPRVPILAGICTRWRYQDAQVAPTFRTTPSDNSSRPDTSSMSRKAKPCMHSIPN